MFSGPAWKIGSPAAYFLHEILTTSVITWATAWKIQRPLTVGPLYSFSLVSILLSDILIITTEYELFQKEAKKEIKQLKDKLDKLVSKDVNKVMIEISLN